MHHNWIEIDIDKGLAEKADVESAARRRAQRHRAIQQERLHDSVYWEDWEPDDTARVEGECCTWCIAHLWIIPAKVEGNWRLPEGELSISQQFQMISGTLKSGGNDIPISGRLTGDKISFTAGATEYSGKVIGDAISGIAKSGSDNIEWNATREK